MDAWVTDELRYLDLGDPRRARRLERIVSDLAAHPSASLSQASGDWAATKAAYRFFASNQISPDAIRQAHARRTLDRIQTFSTVLAIQDTSELDFTSHPHTSGLGHLDGRTRRGLKLHSALGVSPDGIPLGLVAQTLWARDLATIGINRQRRQRPFEEKESLRWVTTLDAISEALPGPTQVVVVTDCEGDMFELFAAPRPDHVELLIRGAYERRVTEPAHYLWQSVHQTPVRGRMTVTVGRRPGQCEREAEVVLRWANVHIRPPHRAGGQQGREAVEMVGLWVEEEEPPEGVEAVGWWLLTTLEVEEVEQAVQVVRWYSYRWLIERYHYVLKSGCRVEALQLERAEGLEVAVATYSLVAWRLLWLTYRARVWPGEACTSVLEEDEWQALYCTIHKTREVPKEVPTLEEATRWVGRLGGHLGRRGDGPPGVKALWQGLRRLEDIVATWRLLKGGSST